MNMTQLIAVLVTALIVLGLVATRLIWVLSQVSAGLGLGRIPSKWIPAKLMRWLLGDTKPKPTRA
jgi:hypothetical protein